MEWMSAISGAVDGVSNGGLIGGITGLITGLGSKYADIKNKKIDLQDRMAQREHDIAMFREQANATRQQTEDSIRQLTISAQEAIDKTREIAQGRVAEELVKSSGLDVANSKDLKYPFFRFIEGARRFVRPFSAYYGWFAVTSITVWTYSLYQGVGSESKPGDLYALLIYMVNVVCFLAMQSIMHWIIVRDKSPEFPSLTK